MSGEASAESGGRDFGSRGAAGPLLRAVLAYRWVVVLVAVATLAGGIAYLAHRTSTYRADVQVLFTPLASGDGAEGFPLVVSSADPTRDAQTGVTLLGGPQAAALAARRLRSGWSAARVTQATSILQTGQSNIIAIEGRAQSAGVAARLAKAFAQASLAVRQAQLRRVAVIASQTVPANPGPNDVAGQARRAEINLILAGADPNFSLQGPTGSASSTAIPAAAVLALAALGGIALGVVLAILFDVFSNRIRDGEELHELYPVPVLGHLPRLSRRERAALHKQVVSKPLLAPARLLASRVTDRARGSQVLLATGASPGDGATTTTLQLARALIASGRRVLLIDCDLQTADASQRLGIGEDHAGLAEVLTGEASLSECVAVAPALPDLRLLPAARPRKKQVPSPSLGRQLRNVVHEARRLADCVLIDTAPLGKESDVVAVVEDVDEVLVMARPGHTRRAEFTLLRDLLHAARPASVSLVVVGERSWQPPAPAIGGVYGDDASGRPVVAAGARRAQRRARAARANGAAAEKRRSKA